MQLAIMYLPLLAVVITSVSGQFTFYQPNTGQQYYPPQAAAVPQQPFDGWQRWNQPQLPQQLQFFPQQQQQQLQQPQQPQLQQQQNFATGQSTQVFARPMVAFPPQQVQQPALQQQPVLQQQQQQPVLQQQQQHYFRFKEFPQFQSAEVTQQFPPPNTVNTQFQPNLVHQASQVAPQQHIPNPPSAPIKVNKEKFLRSETPKIYDQQFRIQTLTQNEINVQQAQQGEQRLPVQQRIRAPPPPERFIPHLADIYGQPMPDRPYSPPKSAYNITTKSLPEAYGPEEKFTDGHHPSYIEDTAKTTPAEQFRRMIQQPRQPQAKRIKSNDISGAVVRRPNVKTRPAQTNRSRVIATTRSPPVQRPNPVVQQRPNPVATPQRPLAIVVPNRPIPKVSVPVNSAQKANDIFLGCCKSINVAKSCERICNFDVLNKKTLTAMFLGTDPCPQSYGLDLMQCAAQSRDHTECCIERGVQTTSAGNKCLGFCNMRPGNSFQADVSMLPCWSVLNDIKSCFRDHIQDS